MNSKGIALVTGAGTRVGKSIALRLGEAGYTVAVHYNKSRKEALSTVSQLNRKIIKGSKKCAAFSANLKNVAQIHKLTAQVEKNLGPITLLVNSASDFKPTPIKTTTEKDWDSSIDINLKSVFFLSQCVSKKMLKRKDGLIINIEDVAAYRPYRGYSPYLTAKAGVSMLTRVLALELAPHIRVCGVAPGAVMFPKGYSASKKKRALKNVPMGRSGSPEDIASIVSYLAVEGNYINGSTIFVDGGRIAAN